MAKAQSYERCVMSDVCRPVVLNVIRRLGEFKFTVTCFLSTSSQPMSEFHSCVNVTGGAKVSLASTKGVGNNFYLCLASEKL